MREIKFRAKRIDIERWVYGDYFHTPLTDENSGAPPKSGWFFLTGERRACIVQNNVAFVIDEATVGEFTGLKDKNGKEIYEGDLLRLAGTSGEKMVFVEWDVKAIGFIYTVGQDVDAEAWRLPWERKLRDEQIDEQNKWQRATVIGNIYENPDLLKAAA